MPTCGDPMATICPCAFVNNCGTDDKLTADATDACCCCCVSCCNARFCAAAAAFCAMVAALVGTGKHPHKTENATLINKSSQNM